MIIINQNEGLKFVTEALSKDDARPSLQLLHVTEEFIEATDGHRLHRIDNKKPGTDDERLIEPGLYHVLKAKKAEVIISEYTSNDVTYPDTNRIWPDVSGKKEFNLRDAKFNNSNMDLDVFYSRLVKEMNESESVCYKYFKSIYEAGFDKVFISEAYSALVFLNGEKSALLMPIRF